MDPKEFLKRFYEKSPNKDDDFMKEAHYLLNYLTNLKKEFEANHAYRIDEWIEYLRKALSSKNQNVIKICVEEINKKLNFELKSEFQDMINGLDDFALPKEIKSEIILDFKEAINSFSTRNFRASIMLCARVLETILFRKYYDLTNKDLLETAPNYGLGKLVAELRKLNQIDPAIMQQIHLINQIRIYSVHKKKDPFLPTREQTKAILLYTFDLIKKLYGR